MKYKVVNDFGCLVKGDEIEEKNGAYVFEERVDVDGFKAYRYAEFDKEAIDEEVESGNLIELQDIDPFYSEHDKAWEKTMTLLEELDKRYAKDYENLMEDYANGNVPTCMKVEAETVYENMGKLINTIKKSLNGEEVKIND